jgi:hypothetical protein
MDNNFDGTFAAWPERWYIIWHDQVKEIGEPTTEFGYDRDHFKSQIASYSFHQANKKL